MLFKSIEVVPECYEEKYWAKLRIKNTMGKAYVSQISHKQFVRLDKNGQLYEQKYRGQLGQWFIKVHYDEGLGLILDEHSSNIL